SWSALTIILLLLSGCVGRIARFDDEEGQAVAPPAQKWQPVAPRAGAFSGRPLALARLTEFIQSRNHRLDANQASNLASVLAQESAQAAVDEGLVAAVVAVESGFDANSTSDHQAMGLGQLLPGTAKTLGVENPYDPEQNLRGTARYLAWLLALWNGRVDLALASYNCGIYAIRRQVASGQALQAYQQRYVTRVLGYYQALEGRS
ncbi:MAG: lytic transglycosylase domain-containing protein, partial [Cyanobacteria bacterium REEB65]|nr:lytic transglycosylase domain-containing protein [Cyanobacteria bacterium REEB65]